MVLSKALLIEDSLIDTFDATLVARGHTALVEKERQVKSSGVGDAVQRLGKLAGKPFAKFTPKAIIRYLMYLPLNFIPVVGTVMFVVLQARRYGPHAHSRYVVQQPFPSMLADANAWQILPTQGHEQDAAGALDRAA